MGMLSKIWDRIRGHKAAAPAGTPENPAVTGTAAPAATVAPASPAVVDVEQVLEQMAQSKGGGGNWRTSIVDLLKLLDMDSSLEARKELAGELGVAAGAHGSAEQNIALSKAVWKQLAANGGRVPASLQD
jgi:hypothetical protein